MARDKYFNNHGRKNRFYAKGDLCRHEYIEKYYPIYDEARVPKLDTHISPQIRRTRSQLRENVTTTVYYDRWYYALANVEEYYTNDLIQGDHREFCMIEYGDGKHYIYRNINRNYSYWAHCKINRSRGRRGFTGYSHVVYDIEDIIDNIRIEYPGCLIYCDYYRPVHCLVSQTRLAGIIFEQFNLRNYLIYMDYHLYKSCLWVQRPDIKYSEFYNEISFIFYHKICQDYFTDITHNIGYKRKFIHNIFRKCAYYRHQYTGEIVIFDIDRVFRKIWNRRRHAIIAPAI
jgi:hypothetical protein